MSHLYGTTWDLELLGAEEEQEPVRLRRQVAERADAFGVRVADQVHGALVGEAAYAVEAQELHAQPLATIGAAQRHVELVLWLFRVRAER